MKNIYKRNSAITIVSLVVTIIILIILAGVSINLTLGENGIITIAKQAKENTEFAKIEEETMLNELYTQIESEGGNSGLSYDAIMMLKEFRKKIATAITNEGVKTLETDTAETMAENIGKIKDNIIQEGATVTEDKILKDYTAYKDGKLITGTMENNGAISTILNAGESYTIPVGYHNGSGKITANSLESQTQATATASDIANGKTAWINGELVTGTSAASNTNIPVQFCSTWKIAAGSNSSIGSIPYQNTEYVSNTTLKKTGYYTFLLTQNNSSSTNSYFSLLINGVEKLRINGSSSNKVKVYCTSGQTYSILQYNNETEYVNRDIVILYNPS